MPAFGDLIARKGLAWELIGLDQKQCASFTVPPWQHRKFSFCPMAVIISPSVARAADPAAGVIWQARVGGRMPRAIAGELSFMCAIARPENSGPPLISRRCVRLKVIKCPLGMPRLRVANTEATCKYT